MSYETSQIIENWTICSTSYSYWHQQQNHSPKLRVTGPLGALEGNPLLTSGSPHKGPQTLAMFSYHDATFHDRCRYQTDCGRTVQEADVRYLRTPTSEQWWSIEFSVDNILTLVPLGDVAVILKVQSSNLLCRIVAWTLAVKLLTIECQRTSLMRSKYWLEFSIRIPWSQCSSIGQLKNRA